MSITSHQASKLRGFISNLVWAEKQASNAGGLRPEHMDEAVENANRANLKTLAYIQELEGKITTKPHIYRKLDPKTGKFRWAHADLGSGRSSNVHRQLAAQFCKQLNGEGK